MAKMGATSASYPYTESFRAVSPASSGGRVTRTFMSQASGLDGHGLIRSQSLYTLTVLGIETSCDETAAAVVRGLPPGPGEILSNIVFSQTEAHAPYGGVVPEIASRAHLEILDGIVQRALDEAGLKLAQIDAIAATAGPGLIG